MDAHIVLLDRTLMLYLYNGHAKWTLNKGGYGMIPCTAGPAISFKCRRNRIGLPPVSGISPVPFHAWRMRHRKKRRRIPKEMRRPEAFRGTLGSEDGVELRQKVPGEETVLDALPE